MALNQLIAQGGRQIKSPVQRYMETRGQMQREQGNQLAMAAQTQNMAAQRQSMDMQRQKQKQAQMQGYGKAVVPLIEWANKQDDKQTAYLQVLPEMKKIGDQFGADTSTMSQMWDQAKADSLMSQFGKVKKAPTTRTILEGVEKVNQEWDTKTETWKEVGRGITSQITGDPSQFDLTKSGKSKIQIERADAEVRLEKKLRGYDFIEDLVNNPDFVGGPTGKAISLVNSASAQFRQATGDEPVINNGRINLKRIDPDSSLFRRLRKSAVISDQLDAATVELAYILAKDNDKGGRVTDKDYEAAERMMGSSSDRASRLSILDNRRKEDVQFYNDQERIYGKRFKGYSAKTYEVKPKKEVELSAPTQKDIDDLVNKYAK